MKKKNSFLKSYKKLRVLITGTTGFKGAWLAFWLNSLGARVTGIALKPEKDSILFKSLNLISKIDQHFIDINNFTKVNQLIKKTKPDIVFHLAAQSIVSNSFSLPLETFKTNIMGSANVLEAYRINRVPYLVYISSDKCYLNFNKEKNFKESDSLGGLDNYSSSKASAEMIFSSYFNNYFKKKKFLTVASARAGNVIGGGDMKKNRIRFFLGDIRDYQRLLIAFKNVDYIFQLKDLLHIPHGFLPARAQPDDTSFHLQSVPVLFCDPAYLKEV